VRHNNIHAQIAPRSPSEELSQCCLFPLWYESCDRFIGNVSWTDKQGNIRKLVFPMRQI